MTEYIKISKTVVSTDNDYDVSGSPLTVDLSHNTLEIVQTVTNDVKAYNRPSTKSTVKPEKRVFNTRRITDKIVVKGRLTRNDDYDAMALKNQILAMQQSPGFSSLTWRQEVFDGSDTLPFTNPKKVVLIQAKFTDSIRKPFATYVGQAKGTQTSTTLKDTDQSWDVNELAGSWLFLVGGTGIGQGKQIVSNTSDTITVSTWGTDPVDANTYYYITKMKEDEVAYDFTLTFLKAVSRT